MSGKPTKKSKATAALFAQNLSSGLGRFDRNLSDGVRALSPSDTQRHALVSASIVLRGLRQSLDEAVVATRKGVKL